MKGQPGILYIDAIEADKAYRIADGIAVVADVPSEIQPLNLEWLKADYYQVDPLDGERMVERKQTSEALSDIDGLEEQLGRQLHHCDELTLLVEGVAKPVAGGVQTYKYRGGTWVPGYLHEQQNLWSRWNAFKYILWHDCGIHVEEVSHWQGTLAYLITWFKRAQDPANQVLKRYIVPHMPPFDKDPHVDNLCRMKGMRIGQTRALELVAEFGTFAAVINAPYSDLVALQGGPWTKHFLEAVGRES